MSQRHPYEMAATPDVVSPGTEKKGDYFDDKSPVLATTNVLSKVDIESAKATTNYTSTDTGLRPTFKARHIQLITLGGSIGTGLFLSLGSAIAVGGPLGALLAYGIISIAVFNIMTTLCEVMCQFPMAGGHISMIKRFSDPALSFSAGWAYWYTYCLGQPVELVAGAVLISFWNQTISPAVWITVLMVCVFAVNIGGSRWFSEFESVFACLKVMLIVGLIIAGIVIVSGGGPDHDAIGFRYWNDPGPLVQFLGYSGARGRFFGVWAAILSAVFSLFGTELTALAAAETKDPRRSFPRAIKLAWVRIVVFYMLGILIAGMCVPSNDPSLNLRSTAAKSPFVIAMKRAGISGLPSVVNAGVLTSALSAGTCYVFISSRTLHGMALSGTAPKIFSRTTSWGLPHFSLLMSFLLGLLGYMVAGTETAGEAFWYIATLCTSAGMQCWICINISFIRYMKGLKAQGIDRNTLPYKAPLQPYLSFFGAGISLFALLTQSYTIFLPGQWDTPTFITSYISIPLQGILYVGWKFYHKTTFVKAEDMDFVSGASLETEPLPPPKNVWHRIYRFFF